MRLTIRLTTNTSYSLTVPDNSTVQDLRASAKVACPSTAKLPTDFKLIFNGQKLDPYYKSLLDFGIKEDGVTIILMSSGAASPLASPSLGPTTIIRKTATGASTKSKKSKCSFKSCGSAPLRIVGECSHCMGKFCAKHRLLEDHHCQDLQYCRDSAHERNAMKLHNESTLASSKV